MNTTYLKVTRFEFIFTLNKSKMRNKAKTYFFRTFILGVLLVGAISCTTTNPPVNATTGATTTYPKK